MNKSHSLSSTAAAASFLLLLAVAALTFHSAAAFPPCEAGVDIDLEECRFGVSRDYCGRLVCARAPDEKCGGLFNFWGTCGGGLVCQCGRCVGCSTDTMQCSVHKQSGCDQ